MSHRNGQPKPNATERTWRRHRAYHNVSTPQDEAHFKRIDEIKSKMLEWLGLQKQPEVKLPAIKGGR